MAKKAEETTIVSTLQDLLIFQMAVAGVPQAKIREAVGLSIDRVNKIAKLAKKTKKADEQ
jgi:hypothetical protein